MPILWALDPLMRPLDPEHTAEFLDKISGRKYFGPFVPLQEDLRGNWKLDLLGGMPGKVDLLLVQNRDAVFGRGTLSLAGSTFAVSASGRTVKDVLYLDLVNVEELTLYRCTLTDKQGHPLRQLQCLRCSGPGLVRDGPGQADRHSMVYKRSFENREPSGSPMIYSSADAIRLSLSPRTRSCQGIWGHIVFPDPAGRQRMSADAFGSQPEVPGRRP